MHLKDRATVRNVKLSTQTKPVSNCVPMAILLMILTMDNIPALPEALLALR